MLKCLKKAVSAIFFLYLNTNKCLALVTVKTAKILFQTLKRHMLYPVNN